MKKYNALYYLLFILLVMGAFASMAQNNYGIKIMGAVAFLFGLIFLVEFISLLRKQEKEFFALAEPVCLFLISVIFGLRIFYIHFPYVEFLFAAAGGMLVLIYTRRMVIRFRQDLLKNKVLAGLLLIFQLSIILFLISLVLFPFTPKIAEITSAGALILLTGFLIAALFNQDLMIDGERVSAFKKAVQFKDHSVIIVSFFLLFSLYVGLNRIGMLPGIYSDEFPQAYFELVNNATSKKEKPVDGKYRHEEFKEKYDQFLKHNSGKVQ